MKYMECSFHYKRESIKDVITPDERELPISECFKYLWSLLLRMGDIDQDMTHRIQGHYNGVGHSNYPILLYI